MTQLRHPNKPQNYVENAMVNIQIKVYSLLFVLNLEESGNLVEGFVFSFGNFFVGEDPEDG